MLLRRDLTPDIWARFAARAHIPDDMEPLTTLENLHLVREGQMTHAGAWLLADDVTRYSLQAGVTCALLCGVTKTNILDTKNFTGDRYTIYEDCVSYARSKLNTHRELGDHDLPAAGGAVGRRGRDRDGAAVVSADRDPQRHHVGTKSKS